MSTIKTNAITTVAGKPILNSTGSILQVVSTTFTSTFSWTTKGSWVDMTGISATITPSSSSNKVLVKVMLSTGDGGNNYERTYRVARGGTAIVEGASIANIMVRSSFATGMGAYSSNASLANTNYIYLDSPASTSALTYQLQGWASTSSVTTSYINQPYAPAAASSSSGISTMLLMEISG